MNEKRYEFTAFDCAYITDHQEHKDYPFIETPEYIEEIVDKLNEQDAEIKKLKKENQKLNRFIYKETETPNIAGNKLYIRDTNTEITMEKNTLYITCHVPFEDGTHHTRIHKLTVVNTKRLWKDKY